MEEQTRQLVELLAKEDTGHVINALRGRALTLDEVTATVPASRSTVERRLHDLERWGLAFGARNPRAVPGRPSKVWEVVSKELDRFDNIVDNFAVELLRSQADRLEDAVDRRRRRELRSVDPVPEDSIDTGNSS